MRISSLLPPSRAFSSKPPKKATKLVGAELTQAISGLQGWEKLTGKDTLVKKYEFADFNECWGVMSRVALLAEKVAQINRGRECRGQRRDVARKLDGSYSSLPCRLVQMNHHPKWDNGT